MKQIKNKERLEAEQRMVGQEKNRNVVYIKLRFTNKHINISDKSQLKDQEDLFGKNSKQTLC
jgi:hypothetical protein